MTLREMIDHLWYVGKQRYKAFVNENGQQAQYSIIGVALLAGAFGGFWLYRSYVTNREQAAQKMLMGAMDMVSRAEENPALWPQVEQLCNEQAQKTSRLAPYFLVYKAEALLKQGKISAAGDELDKALHEMRHDSLYTLFKTKRALVRFDSEDKAEQDKGLKELQELAYDTKNLSRDMALYYLGLYYWQADDREQARKAWTELNAFAIEGDKAKSSPWAMLVKANLEQLTV